MTRQHTNLFGWALALLVAAAFAAAGFWQLQRMHEKQALLAQVPPARDNAVPLARALAAPQTLHWVHDRLAFVDATVLLDNQLRDGRAGLKVYQAARGAGGGPLLLVDLGWLPLPADRQLPPIAPLHGEIELQGLWAPAPAAGIALGPALADTAQARVWLATRLDMAAIATRLDQHEPLPAQVLRLDPALPLGHARDLELLPNTLPPSRHLGYAVQWFGMALAVLAIAAVLQWRRRRARGR